MAVAPKTLGWTEIPANVVDLDSLQSTLAECDENLCGTRLTPSERAVFTAKRKEAYEALYPETRKGCHSRKGKGGGMSAETADTPLTFTKDTAAKTGASMRAVDYYARAGRDITPEALAAVRGTELDKYVVLDQLSTTPREEQMALIEKMREPEPEPEYYEPEQPWEEQPEIIAFRKAFYRLGPEQRAYAWKHVLPSYNPGQMYHRRVK